MKPKPNKLPAVAEAAERWFKPKYTAAEMESLRRHVIKMANGRLETGGDFWTSAADVERLFTVHLPAALAKAKAGNQPLRVLFWAHGGLVPEKDALRQVLDYHQTWLAAGIYPVYFVWKTGILDSFGSLLGGGDERGWFSEQLSDPLLELSLRGAATAVWSEIKRFAAAASGPEGGAAIAAAALKQFHDRNRGAVECYACGHSAGSIFHAHWLPRLAAAGIPLRELFLLAPAATIGLFEEKIQRLIGPHEAIRRCSMFTMTEHAERRDHVVHLYRKSLLYFVSRACEDRREQPILGLEEALRAQAGMRVFWGLDENQAASAELVLSPTGGGAGLRASNATAHGTFDNDADTLNSLVRRITGNRALEPFNDANTPRGMEAGAFAAGDAGGSGGPAPVKPALEVTISLRHGGIDEVKAPPAGRVPPIRFRAAGHYEGTEPMGPERALDRWVSGIRAQQAPREGVVAGMTRRGAMGGMLGQTTLLPHESGEFAVFVGLGRYGCLGPAELTSAVRELCLEVSQLKGRHLATVLIGGGPGNMSMDTAAGAWLRGLQQAQDNPDFGLTHLTFVEYYPQRYLELENALGRALLGYQDGKLEISSAEYDKAVTAAESQAKKAAADQIRNLTRKRTERLASGGVGVPEPASQGGSEICHITVRADGDCCHFTAMTQTAAVPERVIRLDPQIIDEISRSIAAATDPESLRQWGRTLQQLLIPRDLNAKLFSSAAPLVMTLDATTARVPWELLTIPDRGGELGTAAQLLGLAAGYGVTRQLQTVFAAVPERSRGKPGDLSVIIVADPAEDASLPGARREAKWVESFFKTAFPAARVVCLEGPTATRAHLAKELCNHAYDILHFAGHCYFNTDQPGKSGWIFRRDPLQVFSADELLRLDRVPSFIFSNACESGVTPDRAHLANPGVGPAFAEAFFAKGVSNFVCTGWPVNDRAALVFARRFYSALFEEQATLQRAMLSARQAVTGISWQTVGAYQHYGSPFHAFAGNVGPGPETTIATATKPPNKAKPKRIRNP